MAKTPTTMKDKLIIFVPVLHRGYVDLFKKYPDDVRILGRDVIDSYTSLYRDLRVVDPALMANILRNSGLVKKASVVSAGDLKKIGKEKGRIVLVDDDVSRDLSGKYLKNANVLYEKIFLRWDKLMTEAENVVPEGREVSTKESDRKIMGMAGSEAERSSDWWRQIGAVAVKGGKILFKNYNRHLPTDHHLGTYGDPRSNFDKGERMDVYTSIHCEADIVAQAAKKGISLKGASVYVLNYPCPNCARLLSEAGVGKVFYQKGYSRMDAESILNAKGVKIILVQ